MGSKLDELDRANQDPLSQPTFILCEGKSDAAFFFRLTRERGLNGFQFGWAGGKTEFGSYLNGLRTRIKTGFERVIIVRDCDENPQGAFDDVVAQIRTAQDHPYPIPVAPKIIATERTPHIAVLLLPDSNQNGTLETILVESIRDRRPDLFQCMLTYAQCTGTVNWDIGKYSKMQLHSLIAASCPKNPGCSLTIIWADRDNPIALDHPCFNPLCDYLGQFSI
jgi:hypothetical protein